MHVRFRCCLCVYYNQCGDISSPTIFTVSDGLLSRFFIDIVVILLSPLPNDIMDVIVIQMLVETISNSYVNHIESGSPPPPPPVFSYY